MKTNKDILSSILKTVQMGQCGIRCVQEKATGAGLQQALGDQLREYDAIEEKTYDLAARRGLPIDGLSPSVEKMAGMMAHMQLMSGEINSKIAKMLVQGNTRGMIKSLKNLHRYDHSDAQVEMLANALVQREKENIRQASEFL